MTTHRRWLALTALLMTAPLDARQDRTFEARLSTVPITVAEQDRIAGRGSARAALEGSRLRVEGRFEGLRSAATVARIHVAPPGTRGPAMLDLRVTAAPAGTVEGTFDLSDRQRDALEAGSFYIQIHSETAPDGNLWGWLLPQGDDR